MNRTRKIIVGAGLALAMMVGGLVAASPASASATWCLPTSQVKVFGVTVPVGQYCFSVIGSGTRVDFTSGSWNGVVVVNGTLWPSVRLSVINVPNTEITTTADQ